MRPLIDAHNARCIPTCVSDTKRGACHADWKVRLASISRVLRQRASSPGTQRNDDPRPARLAITDRDLGLRLPDVELAGLTGPIDRALIGALIDEERANLAQESATIVLPPT
jgi:hypothetical protein